MNEDIIYQGNSIISIEILPGYSHPVVIKKPSKHHSSRRNILSLEKEYEMTRSLNAVEGVRQALEQQSIENQPVLILEYIDGEILRDYIARTTINLHSRLEIAVDLAHILGTIHQQNIIHLDLNSKNILIGNEPQPVHLIDLGSTSRVDGNGYQKVRPDQMLGTLPYISPERDSTPIITAYRNYLKQELEWKSATINRYLVSLKRYFRWARDTDRIRRDPAGVVKLVEETAQAPRHLSDEEEADLIAAVEASDSLRDYTLVVLMLHTGLRVSEVCHLKWGHVVCDQRSGHVKVWGKGNKYRQVPLNATVRRALQAYEATIARDNDQFLFLSQRTKTHLTPRGLGFSINKYAHKAGLKALRPHDLRHRFGYRMAAKVPLHRLAQLMGHDSLDTTLIYIQGTPSDLHQAVEQIAWK